MDLKTKKYIIRKDAAFLQVHGLPYVYINKGAGPESDSAKHLTDAIAIKLLEEKPDRAEVIILNPDYEEPVAKLPKDPGTGKSKTAAKHKGTGKKKVDSVPPVAPPAPADQTDTQTDPAPPAAAPSSDSGSDDQNDDDDPADDDEGVDEEDENKDSDSNDQ
ncbi:hypothetical protein [Spirosoma agri]|uniref:Uncharacterized protein n=1 Tax=Spirosoma agri TaxID=1987381 RepID=A0A6M0II67_9BACT|nr:hypothetical protein [Spirosoma agri]NEU67956.1 hypothetical protein [Spirosoma agri]